MPRKRNRSARIEARTAPEALAVVKRGAEIQGHSVSDFVVAAAQEAAHRTIEETHLIRLAVEDQRRFVDLLLNPPEPSPALWRAKEAHGRLVRQCGVATRIPSTLERFSSGKRINHASDDTLWTQLIRSVPEGDDVVYQDLGRGTIDLYFLDKKTQDFSFLLE